MRSTCTHTFTTAKSILVRSKSYQIIDKLLDSIVITDIDLVQVDGEVYVVPHVVVMLDVTVKAISTTLKLMAGNATDEAYALLILLRPELEERRELKSRTWLTEHAVFDTYPLVSKFRESVNDDTKDNVEANGRDNDEE